jgi:hypothetical protein
MLWLQKVQHDVHGGVAGLLQPPEIRDGKVLFCFLSLLMTGFLNLHTCIFLFFIGNSNGHRFTPSVSSNLYYK